MYTEYKVIRALRQSNTNRNWYFGDIICNLLNHSCNLKSYTFFRSSLSFSPPISCLFFVFLPNALCQALIFRDNLFLSETKQMVMSRPAAASQFHPLMEHQQTHSMLLSPHTRSHKPTVFHLTCAFQSLKHKWNCVIKIEIPNRSRKLCEQNVNAIIGARLVGGWNWIMVGKCQYCF